MPIRTELNLRLANSPGALESVCRTLGEERVGIAALMLDSAGQLRLVVDNHLRAAAILRDRHHGVTERAVLTASLPDTPGALAHLLRLLQDARINVDYVYAGGTNGLAMAVIGVDDAMRAAAATGI
jgi:hypothetical protein